MKYKINDNTRKAASLLLKIIIRHHGGISKVARLRKVSRQLIHSFTKCGYIPLSVVYSMARSLKVSVWALSYIKLIGIFGEESVPFETILNDLNFLKEDKEKILKIYKKK